MFNKLIVLRFRNFAFSFLFTRTQVLEGITTEALNEKGKHHIFFDFDKMNESELKIELLRLINKYHLADMFIVSDKPESYRVFCFSIRTLREYLHILFDTKGLEWDFLYWTVKRKKGTLRTVLKANRTRENISVLKGIESYEIPDKYRFVFYETGLNKIKTVVLS